MLVLTIVVVALVFLSIGSLGFQRIKLPRYSSFEAIENKDAAAAYERINQWPQFRLLRRMILAKLEGYTTKGILIDIGCGPGRLLFLISQKFKDLKLKGIDASKEMIEIAKSKAVEEKIEERIAFCEGDVENLPLQTNSIDFAISTLSLHHWSNPRDGLSEIHRVLKPGGQLLLFDLRRDARRFFYWLIVFAQSVVVPSSLRKINEPMGSLQSSYTYRELQKLMEDTPFKEWKVIGKIAWAYTWGRK
jgi:ubiquinone/menaquinone biosynthesis C-methylase UbiE